VFIDDLTFDVLAKTSPSEGSCSDSTFDGAASFPFASGMLILSYAVLQFHQLKRVHNLL
jgi:hypothetical protein